MQEVFRTEAVKVLSGYGGRLRDLRTSIGEAKKFDSAVLLDSLVNAAVASMERLRTTWPNTKIDAAAQILGRSETIFIHGKGRSFPLACYFADATINLGMKIMLMDQDEMALVPISGRKSSDSLVVIGFSPYSTTTQELVRQAITRQVPIVAITDNPSAPLVPSADVVFQVTEGGFSEFQSLASSLCLIDVLALGAARFRG